jgi:hypothetical protein
MAPLYYLNGITSNMATDSAEKAMALIDKFFKM